MLKSATPSFSTRMRVSSLFISRSPKIICRQHAVQTAFPHSTEIAPPPPLRSVQKRSTIYQLPVDDEESTRLNTQHVLLKMLIGGNYLGPVKEVLGSAGKRFVLDVGCGSCSFALDMAKEFPEAQVIGCDVAPMQRALAPPNLRIDIHDANQGLAPRYGEVSMDMINARMVAMGITNYAKLIKEMTKVLRPGGLLHLQEWDFFIAAGSEKVRLSDNASPFARWCSKFREGLQARKASIEAGTTLEAMTRSQNAFGEVHQKDIWMPVGPPHSKDQPQSTHMNLVGDFMRENVKAFIKGARAVILHGGMSLEECIQLELDAIRDIQFSPAPLFLRLNCVWAQKLVQQP